MCLLALPIPPKVSVMFVGINDEQFKGYEYIRINVIAKVKAFVTKVDTTQKVKYVLDSSEGWISSSAVCAPVPSE